jgi:signal transduction histidine kinase
MGTGSGGRGRILLVEDDFEVQAIVSQLLEVKGYEVSSAPDGRKALEKLRAGELPNLIILDLMMPVMDGWQFRVEQRRDPKLAEIPVVVLSADSSAKAAAVDAAAFLRKPVQLSVLIDKIEQVYQATLERRRREERLARTEQLAVLGQLAAGVSHEVNNVLSFVMANVRTMAHELPPLLERYRQLSGDSLSPAAQANLDELIAMPTETLEGTERMYSVLRELRLSSRTEDKPEVRDVLPVIEGAVRLVRGRIREKAQLVLELEPLPPLQIVAGRVHQVVLNLLLNACDALPEHQVAQNTIRVATRRAKDRALIEVSDTGSGIAPEVLQMIFEPFFTTKPADQGTGLGLYLCKEIARSLGGELTVETAVGQGTTFRLSLPITAAAE